MAEKSAPHIVLNPGDIHFGAAPLKIATLLGSCVTVTLWHPRRHIGGMCHIRLPMRSPHPGRPPDGCYADEAFILFDQAMHRHHCHAGELQAKLFGGGDMFPNMGHMPRLGDSNLTMARKQLQLRGIPLLAEHVGNTGHRKLIFDLETGEVQLFFVTLNKD